MKVSEHVVGTLIGPFYAVPDHSEMMSLDINDKLDREKLIRSYIVPHYELFSHGARLFIKESLKWLLYAGQKELNESPNKELYETLFFQPFNESTLNVDVPKDLRSFYFDTWRILFPLESEAIENVDAYEHVTDTRIRYELR